MNELTQEELLAKLESMGPLTDEQRNRIVCALIGHSRIQEVCFGYVYCGRCGAEVGDTLGGVYDLRGVVIIGHNCDQCRANYAALTWKDKLFTPDPFAVEEARS